MTATELADQQGTSKYYVRVVRLRFLAPQVAEAIPAGQQPAALDAKTLLGLHGMPLAWNEQICELALRQDIQPSVRGGGASAPLLVVENY